MRCRIREVPQNSQLAVYLCRYRRHFIVLKRGQKKLDFSKSAEPAGKKRKSRHAHRCGILPRHSAERRIASKRSSAGEGKARARDDAINPEAQRIENLRTECMRFV